MPLTIADLEDARMQARERRREWKRERDANFFRPLREAMIGGLWNGTPANVRSNFEQMKPDTAQKLNTRYGRKNGR